MKYFNAILLLFFTASVFVNAQEIKLYGTPEPAGLMIGEGSNIESVTLDDKPLQIDPRGIFVFGFDRDAKGTHILKIIYNNKTTETKKIKLPKRKYIIQKLKVAEKYVTPPKYEMERIEKEAGEMKKARATIGIVDSAFFASGFTTPLDHLRKTSEFGSQRILNGVPESPHNGIDLGADKGSSVYATADGIVAIAGHNFYYNGNFVLLDHGQGLTSVYLHFSKLLVKTGDHVAKGQKIGEVGTTGRSTAPHLHFGIQWYNKRIDPSEVLKIKLPEK